MKKLEEKGEIPENSFVKADMRNIPFANNTFDIVRQYASLVHMPITTKGKMLDKALQENHRVLKENGVLFVAVKKGKGIQYLKTKTGVDARIFQMHTIESITEALERNGFLVIKIMEVQVQKQEKMTNWINVIAKKNR